MNTSPVLHSFLSGADRQSEQPVADLAARAAQMYRSQYGGTEPSTDSRSLYANGSDAVQDAPPSAPPSKPPPYAEEFFQGLKNIKPERIETVDDDGSIKVTYNYYTPFYAYMRDFPGKGDGTPTYPLIQDQMDLIRWCTQQLTPGQTSNMPVPPGNGSASPEYDLRFGLNQTMTCLMSMDYSIKEWMNEIFMGGDDSEDEQTW